MRDFRDLQIKIEVHTRKNPVFAEETEEDLKLIKSSKLFACEWF